MKRTYLGDGVFAEVDNAYVVVSTETKSPVSIHDVIYLDSAVMLNLIEYFRETRQ